MLCKDTCTNYVRSASTLKIEQLNYLQVFLLADESLRHLADRSSQLSLLCVLLRKEVIQPHLPIRLPCYDFTPVIDPAFGSALPYGSGY